jgi:hypothetical protein
MAVFQDDLIRSYRAFLDKRRAIRPAGEYREPTDQEWQEFQKHFQLRKVALGTCGRPYGASCQHEHVPLTELTDARIGYEHGLTDCGRRATSALSESWSSLRVVA